MNSLRRSVILLLFFLICFNALSTASARTIYVDSVNGDDRNPGTSPITPLRSPRPGRLTGNDQLILLPSAKTVSKSLVTSAVRSFDPAGEVELERIILGPVILSSWEPFSTTIWQAPLEWQPGWLLTGVSIDGNVLLQGCSADFMESGQYFALEKSLYLNYAKGNPDAQGSNATAYIYDNNTDTAIEKIITGWDAAPPTVWQASFPTKPIHLFVDDTLSDQHSWYGKKDCFEETGQDGYIYLRDLDGNPDDMGKTTSAVVDTGGWSVTAGDFNGDGLQDVVHSNGDSRIYVNYGAPQFSPSPAQVLDNPNGEAGFGYYVGSAGDVNNDHFDDLIVAMDWGVGKVYLYMGTTAGLEGTPSQILTPPKDLPVYGFGHGIGGNGDINGDGFSDILIMGGDDSSAYLGVYLGSASGCSTDPIIISFAGKIFGGSVCMVGDMNNDDFDDVAVSVANAVDKEFEVRIYYGSKPLTLDNPSIYHIPVPKQDSEPVWMIGEVAAAGDVNGDEKSDLIIGNQWASGTNGANQGEAYLILGPANAGGKKPDINIANPKPEEGARFGRIVAGLGDFDRDGHADIAAGSPYSNNDRGFVSIFSISEDGLSAIPTNIIAGVGFFGWSLSRAGDLKKNGQPYLIAGEEFGGAYLYALPCDTFYFHDADNDHFGAGEPIMACMPPDGYVSDDSDCKDADPAIHPGAEEICNGVDDNCDGLIDEGCPPPVAEAGPDLQAVEGTRVKLDGSASVPADASRQITAYSWTQINGPNVFLSNAGGADPGFMTPPVGTEGAVLVFQLTVEDTIGLTGTDEVTITIQDNGITGFPADVLTFYCANGQPAGVKVQGGANLLSIVPVDPSTLPAADHTPGGMIYGLFDITIGVPTPGTQAEVTFYFPSPAESSHAWVRYNAADGWSDFSDHSSFGADRKSIAIHLTDGATGDDDQSANNVIENTSGLGVLALQPAGDDTAPGGGGGGGGSGCFISVMKHIAF